ncbi:hypothetical protein O59_001411 [Cellvibrio sp. BR]|jgi:hypothetical protein|nr:hypothetical protein O59_001411 [Cellvibrio sp. BR]
MHHNNATHPEVPYEESPDKDVQHQLTPKKKLNLPPSRTKNFRLNN